MRIDVYLTEHGYVASRTRARRLIESGKVILNGRTVRRPSELIQDDDVGALEVGREDVAYVGRGGCKLEAALEAFSLPVRGSIALDIGASTGGFTDCLLQHGAKEVYAIDAGRDQLAPSLRNHPAVHNIEQCNARYLTPEALGTSFCLHGGADIIVMDLSFISQTCVLPILPPLLRRAGQMVTLIKPQFELEKGRIGKGGIVKNPDDRRVAVKRVLLCAQDAGFRISGLIRSPITGGDGNVEFLAHFCRGKGSDTILEEESQMHGTKDPASMKTNSFRSLPMCGEASASPPEREFVCAPAELDCYPDSFFR